MKAITLILILYSTFSETKWTEEQYQTFEKSLMILADKYFPPQRFRRAAPCPGGNGKFGFNSYQFLTNIVLGFSAVSSIIANINNNLNNNNNNNNQNDVGNVQGSSQVMKIPGLFFTKHSPFQFDILFLNLVHVFRTQI